MDVEVSILSGRSVKLSLEHTCRVMEVMKLSSEALELHISTLEEVGADELECVSYKVFCCCLLSHCRTSIFLFSDVWLWWCLCFMFSFCLHVLLDRFHVVFCCGFDGCLISELCLSTSQLSCCKLSWKARPSLLWAAGLGILVALE